jgi:predicted transcriptional regulator
VALVALPPGLLGGTASAVTSLGMVLVGPPSMTASATAVDAGGAIGPVQGQGASSAADPPPSPTGGSEGALAPLSGRHVVRPLGFLRVLADVRATLVAILRHGGVPLMLLWHRVRGARLLDHPIRSAIAQAVSAAPGLHVRDLARRLSAHPKTVGYHVHRMAAEELLTLEHDGPLLRVFPTGRGGGEAAQSTRTKVLELLARGARSRASLAAAADVTPQAISYHMSALAREGRVARLRRGMEVAYVLREPRQASRPAERSGRQRP